MADFKHKNLEISWCIEWIKCQENKVESKVIAFYKGHIATEYLHSIPIDNSDYTQETFERNLRGSCLEVIDKLERYMAHETYEYSLALEMNDKQEDTLTKIASDFLDKEGVSNEAIREAYIYKYVEDNSVDYCYDVYSKLQYKKLGNERLLMLSFFNDQETFDKYKDLVARVKKRKKFVYSLWQEGRKLASDEWVERMTDNLEEI